MRRPSRQVAKVAATVAGAVCSTLLFGALHTTVPTIFIATAPVGALIAEDGHRIGGAALAFSIVEVAS